MAERLLCLAPKSYAASAAPRFTVFAGWDREFIYCFLFQL
jgi:hypothetical protein